MTETPPVQEALDALRDEIGPERVRLGELVIIGARQKLEQVRAQRRRPALLRMRLADRVRAGELDVSPKAADEVLRSGWARE